MPKEGTRDENAIKKKHRSEENIRYNESNIPLRSLKGENAKQYYNALFECIDLNISEASTSLDVCAIGEYKVNIKCVRMCKNETL